MSTQATSAERDQGTVSLVFIAIYVLAQFGIWVALLTPVVVTMALRVGDLAPAADKAQWLAMILAVGALVALVSAPLCGAFSDRTRSRFGRRRPWLLGGLVFSGLGLCILGTAESLPALLLGWVICQAGFNAMQSACMPILPDHIPFHLQGRVAGMLGVTSTAATFVGSWLTQYTQNSAQLMFLAPFAITVVGIITLAIVLPDGEPARPVEKSLDLKALARALAKPFLDRDFSWAFLSRFLIMMAWSFLLTSQLFFLTDELALERTEATRVLVRSMATIAVAAITVSIVGGFITDWSGRRKPLVALAAAIEGAGFLTIVFASTVPQFLIGVGIAGLGKGLYFAVDLALLAAILPDPDARAKDMAVFQIANSLPQSLAPAVLPLILAWGNGSYAVVFFAGTLFAIFGALAIQPVKRSS